MAAAGTNSSLRKYLGSIKDTTTISLAKVNGGYKGLDIAVVKATNHVERPAKERHIRAIFAAVSATRPQADVAYCVHSLARRLAKTHDWAVALKTLTVIHRGLREVDPTFREELINYGRNKSRMLNISETIQAQVRIKNLDTVDLLEQLPALQQLLYRILGCQPEGAAVQNHVIQLALSMVASESMKIYSAISDGAVNLIDKFFEMQRHDAIKALDIYRRAGQQVERLSEFYQVCKSLDVGCGEKIIKIEQPPTFLQAMEELWKKPSQYKIPHVKQVVDEKSTVVLVIGHKDITDVDEERPPSPPLKPVKEENLVVESPDLLSLDEPNPVQLDLDDTNALALAIIAIDDPSTTTRAPNLQGSASGWELALVTAPSSNESATAVTKLAGGLDKLTLDSLYDDAMRTNIQPASYNPWEPAPMTTNQPLQAHNPFFASHTMFAPHSTQMDAMINQQQAFLLQQQMMMGVHHQSPTMNPFGNPYGPGMPVQAHGPYTGLL